MYGAGDCDGSARLRWCQGEQSSLSSTLSYSVSVPREPKRSERGTGLGRSSIVYTYIAFLLRRARRCAARTMGDRSARSATQPSGAWDDKAKEHLGSYPQETSRGAVGANGPNEAGVKVYSAETASDVLWKPHNPRLTVSGERPASSSRGGQAGPGCRQGRKLRES